MPDIEQFVSYRAKTFAKIFKHAAINQQSMIFYNVFKIDCTANGNLLYWTQFLAI